MDGRGRTNADTIAKKPTAKKPKPKPNKKKRIIPPIKIEMTPGWRLAAAGIALALVYFGYQFYLSLANRVRTEMVYIGTRDETIIADGVIVRNETVITSAVSGVTVSSLPNGAKVAGNQPVANVFASAEAAEAYRRAAEIDKTIKEFQGMNTGGGDADAAATLKTQIDDRLIRVAKSVNDGDLGKARSLRAELLYLINKRQVAMMVTDGFDGRVSELAAERQALTDAYPAAPTPLTSPFPGYYIDSVDGYESLINTDILPTLTPGGLEEILAMRPDVTGQTAVGKVADDFRWYLCCILSESDAAKLQPGREYTLELPYSGEDPMTGRLMFMTADPPANPPADDVSGGDKRDNDEAETRVLVTFRCGYTLTEMAGVRQQPVAIRVRRASGLCVRSSAIHRQIVSGTDVDEVGNKIQVDVEATGVFTLREMRVSFKEVNIIGEFDGTAVCAVKYETKTKLEYLKQYDEVVVEGRELYGGKLVRGN